MCQDYTIRRTIAKGVTGAIQPIPIVYKRSLPSNAKIESIFIHVIIVASTRYIVQYTYSTTNAIVINSLSNAKQPLAVRRDACVKLVSMPTRSCGPRDSKQPKNFKRLSTDPISFGGNTIHTVFLFSLCIVSSP